MATRPAPFPTIVDNDDDVDDDSPPTSIYYIQLCNCPGSNPSAMRLSCRHIAHPQRCPAGKIGHGHHGREEQPAALASG